MVLPSDVKLAPLPRIENRAPPGLLSRFANFFALSGPSDFISAKKARDLGAVQGNGIVVAVLDSGCWRKHAAFETSSDDQTSRVLPGLDFTGGNDTTDTDGHGTAVSALVAARILAPGVAPKAKIMPLKVSGGPQPGRFSFVLDALTWLLDDVSTRNVNAVCMSIGDIGNYKTIDGVPHDGEEIRQRIARKIKKLHERGVSTVAAAGNGYFAGVTLGTGMCFPAIVPECISVGAVFTSWESGQEFSQYGGAAIVASNPGQLTPFSQRLPDEGTRHFTRLFAPGASIRSAGTGNDTAQTKESYGTSLAAPFAAGVIALMQEWHKRERGVLPSCDDLERWLLQGADEITDDAGELDNVVNTNAKFKYLNALGAMKAMMESSLAS